MNLITFLRNLIRNNPFPYSLWLLLKTKKRAKLPNPNTSLHLTGYQCSGNTFAANYIKCLFPSYSIVTYFHAVASLKAASRHKVPTIVLIRNPEKAILSSVVKRIDGRNENIIDASNKDIKEYINYYSYVLRNVESLHVVEFNMAINKPYLLVKKVADLLQTKKPDNKEISYCVSRAEDNLKSDKRTDGDRNIFSPYKEKKKKKIQPYVTSKPLFKQCIILYEKIKRHA